MEKVSLSEAFRIWRVYRKMGEMKGKRSISRLTVLVRHEDVVRLLKFFGYRQEE